MADVTGSPSRIQACRARALSLGLAAAIAAAAGAWPAAAQDRLPPSPGSVGAIRRDASGQIVPVEPLDPPDRGRRPAARGGAPAAGQGAAAPAGPTANTAAPAEPPPSPGFAPASIRCGSPAIACIYTRAGAAAGPGTSVTLLLSAAPGALALADPDGEPAPSGAGDVPAQVDVLARHEDGSVSQALVTVMLPPQLLNRGPGAVLRLGLSPTRRSLRVSAS